MSQKRARIIEIERRLTKIERQLAIDEDAERIMAQLAYVGSLDLNNPYTPPTIPTQKSAGAFTVQVLGCVFGLTIDGDPRHLPAAGVTVLFEDASSTLLDTQLTNSSGIATSSVGGIARYVAGGTPYSTASGGFGSGMAATAFLFPDTNYLCFAGYQNGTLTPCQSPILSNALSLTDNYGTISLTYSGAPGSNQVTGVTTANGTVNSRVGASCLGLGVPANFPLCYTINGQGFLFVITDTCFAGSLLAPVAGHTGADCGSFVSNAFNSVGLYPTSITCSPFSATYTIPSGAFGTAVGLTSITVFA